MRSASLDPGEKSLRGRLTRSPRKATSDKSKSTRLVCRYCGSEDLAPGFIKRRDRRCRKCFSKRYGSAARVRKEAEEVTSRHEIRGATSRGSVPFSPLNPNRT